jgi:hypothetical protein
MEDFPVKNANTQYRKQTLNQGYNIKIISQNLVKEKQINLIFVY